MEVLVTLGVLTLICLAFVLMEASQNRARARYFRKKLEQDFGKAPDRSYSLERFEKIGSYYRKHPKPYQIDDITWNDLGMDDIFRRMNYSFSATGEEYLYYTLSTPHYEPEALQRMEEHISYMGREAETRFKVQELMNRLGYMGKYSLYDYLDHLDYLGERSNRLHYLLDFLYIPMGIMLPFAFTPALTGLIALMVVNMFTYFKEKGEIDPYIVSFGFVQRLYACGGELLKMQLPGFERETERIEQCRKKLKAMYKGSFWVMSPSRGNATGGNPVDMLFDYLRMIFHVDLIQFNRMLGIMRRQMSDVDGLIETMGYIETTISIACFRASLEQGYTVPEFAADTSANADTHKELILEEVYHPLLSQPVTNSLTTSGPILLTGSNASGKSTFLKTVALAALLAQTIHTVPAKQYRAPMYRVLSSMALRDDLGRGESYYIVEIKAIKRILDEAGKEGEPRLLCFVDEVLRGTNTVERIAASTRILMELAHKGALCFAATHDIELTELLKEIYTNYHFAEEIKEGDIVFNYQLQEGRCSTRNAIRLLDLLGYDKQITEQAMRQAQGFMESGVWKL